MLTKVSYIIANIHIYIQSIMVPRTKLGGSLISTSNSTHIRQSMMDITTLYVLVHGVGHGIPAMDGLHVSVVYV